MAVGFVRGVDRRIERTDDVASSEDTHGFQPVNLLATMDVVRNLVVMGRVVDESQVGVEDKNAAHHEGIGAIGDPSAVKGKEKILNGGGIFAFTEDVGSSWYWVALLPSTLGAISI